MGADVRQNQVTGEEQVKLGSARNSLTCLRFPYLINTRYEMCMEKLLGLPAFACFN